MTTQPCNCTFASFNPCNCTNFPIISVPPAAPQVFGGNGSPVAVVIPTTTFAIYIQQDSAPPGLIWEWYAGAWH